MLKQEVNELLSLEPFVPLRIHLKDRRTFDVPFRDTAFGCSVTAFSYSLVCERGLGKPKVTIDFLSTRSPELSGGHRRDVDGKPPKHLKPTQNATD